MTEEKKDKEKKYVYVKDAENNLYVCRLSDLKTPEELSEEEKELCAKPPGDA